MARERQLELFAPRPLGARERRELIRQRLEGFELRQNAREAKRQADVRRTANEEATTSPHQTTLDELIARLKPNDAR